MGIFPPLRYSTFVDKHVEQSLRDGNPFFFIKRMVAYRLGCKKNSQ